ncbi:MAG: hypothetical protein IPG02_16415 [Ignavibacteria bacterium]|nr:hypothetical protein [Ignavibacteria bacterium]
MKEYGNEYIITGIGRTTDIYDIGKSVIKKQRQLPDQDRRCFGDKSRLVNEDR